MTVSQALVGSIVTSVCQDIMDFRLMVAPNVSHAQRQDISVIRKMVSVSVHQTPLVQPVTIVRLEHGVSTYWLAVHSVTVICKAHLAMNVTIRLESANVWMDLRVDIVRNVNLVTIDFPIVVVVIAMNQERNQVHVVVMACVNVKKMASVHAKAMLVEDGVTFVKKEHLLYLLRIHLVVSLAFVLVNLQDVNSQQWFARRKLSHKERCIL